MAQMPEFERFLQEFGIETGKPAAETEIQQVESKLGFPIPEPIRSCYLTCDGGHAGDSPQGWRSDVELLSLDKVLRYGEIRGFLDGLFGYFPFLENNDSNPVCLCCKSALAGYVVLVGHDGAPRLMFRSLENFFRAAVEHIREVEFFDTHDLPTDFDGPNRTEKDIAIARQLIDQAAAKGTLYDEWHIDMLRFACDLLSDEHIDQIAALLKVKDEYVREHVMRRLKRMPDVKAREALSAFESDFDAFVERCALRLQSEGIEASVHAVYGRKAVRIDPGPIWLNMEALYSDRERPDFEDFLLERVRFFVEYSQKRKQ